MAELSAVAAQLRRAGDVAYVNDRLRNEVAALARPLAPQVRAAVLNYPATSGFHSGLRGRVARCVTAWADIRGELVSVGVAIDASKMPNGEKALPLYMNGNKAPWRHPVYGNTENWVEQPSYPFFEEATAWFGPASRRAVERVVNSLADTVTG